MCFLIGYSELTIATARRQNFELFRKQKNRVGKERTNSINNNINNKHSETSVMWIS